MITKYTARQLLVLIVESIAELERALKQDYQGRAYRPVIAGVIERLQAALLVPGR